MNDYIKREDAVEKIKADCDRFDHIPKRVVDFFTLGMESVPSADVEPVRHGHWKVVNDSYGGKAYICECSECEDTVWVYKDADRKWNYCPNCGARMDGKEQENE